LAGNISGGRKTLTPADATEPEYQKYPSEAMNGRRPVGCPAGIHEIALTIKWSISRENTLSGDLL